MLLQSEEKLLARRTSDLPAEGTASKPKKMLVKMKVQGKLDYELSCLYVTIIGILISDILLILQSERSKWHRIHLQDAASIT